MFAQQVFAGADFAAQLFVIGELPDKTQNQRRVLLFGSDDAEVRRSMGHSLRCYYRSLLLNEVFS